MLRILKRSKAEPRLDHGKAENWFAMGRDRRQGQPMKYQTI